MPRDKLCGEFIAPESFPSLERLGVMQALMSAGAQRLTRASLIVSSGKRVHTQLAKISQDGAWAISLSRFRFDQILFDRARELGVDCREGVAVNNCVSGRGGANGVEALSLAEGSKARFLASLVIDASGRNSRVMLSESERRAGGRGSRLYAFKAHFDGARGLDDQVELHFFAQGYGGLARIEGGLVNLCYIVDQNTLRSAGGDPDAVLERSLMRNEVARERLSGAVRVGKWHSAGPLSFGHRRLARGGVIAIGDASGMIDPFTGTGIQMALRTGEMAAEAIVAALGSRAATLFDSVLREYSARYNREFGSRLKASTLLRAIAFSPGARPLVAGVLARYPTLATLVMRATRSTHGVFS